MYWNVYFVTVRPTISEMNLVCNSFMYIVAAQSGSVYVVRYSFMYFVALQHSSILYIHDIWLVIVSCILLYHTDMKWSR